MARALLCGPSCVPSSSPVQSKGPSGVLRKVTVEPVPEVLARLSGGLRRGAYIYHDQHGMSSQQWLREDSLPE